MRTLQALLREFKGRGIVFAVKFPSLAKYFDHVLVMRSGELVEQGSFESLNRPGTYLTDLLAGENV